MRFSAATAALLALCTPALTAAQGGWPSGSSGWPAGTSTTTTTQATTTVTMTLYYANATSSSNGSWNTTAPTSSFTYPSVNPTAQPSVCSDCATPTGAASIPQLNLAVAALAGAGALVLGSL